MHVNIPQALDALKRENEQLNEIISYSGKAHGYFSEFVSDESLQGQFFGACKKYIHYIGQPLYESLITAVNSKVLANGNYQTSLTRLSAYGSVIDLEELLRLKEKLGSIQSTLKDLAENGAFIILFAINPAFSLIGYIALNTLTNTCSKLDEAINACYRFQNETAGCYDPFYSKIDEMSAVLASAKKVCGPQGGAYNFYNAETRNWAKVSGHEVDLGLGAPESIMNWVLAENGQGNDYDGTGEVWCVDLITGYMRQLGYPPTGGHAMFFDDKIRDNPNYPGWEVFDYPDKEAQPPTLQPGDIIVTDGGNWGHVAIVTEVREDGSYKVMEYPGYNQPGKLSEDYKAPGSFDHVVRPAYDRVAS